MSKLHEATSKINICVGRLDAMLEFGANKNSIQETINRLNEAVEMLNELEVEEWKRKNQCSLPDKI